MSRHDDGIVGERIGWILLSDGKRWHSIDDVNVVFYEDLSEGQARRRSRRSNWYAYEIEVGLFSVKVNRSDVIVEIAR